MRKKSKRNNLLVLKLIKSEVNILENKLKGFRRDLKDGKEENFNIKALRKHFIEIIDAIEILLLQLETEDKVDNLKEIKHQSNYHIL